MDHLSTEDNNEKIPTEPQFQLIYLIIMVILYLLRDEYNTKNNRYINELKEKHYLFKTLLNLILITIKVDSIDCMI